jgi:hypothetical protein
MAINLTIGPASEGTVIDFWQSLCRLSKDRNPAYSNGGSRDEIVNNLREDKSFFYLSVSHQGQNIRDCTINSNQKVVVPSLSFLASEAEREGSDIEELNSFADIDQNNIEQGTQKVTIERIISSRVRKKSQLKDEESIVISDFRQFKLRTFPFQVIYPPQNLFSARSGPSIAIADGAYLVIKGFEDKAEYKIHFEGTINAPDDKDSLEYRTYKEDLTYNLKIN